MWINIIVQISLSVGTLWCGCVEKPYESGNIRGKVTISDKKFYPLSNTDRLAVLNHFTRLFSALFFFSCLWLFSFIWLLRCWVGGGRERVVFKGNISFIITIISQYLYTVSVHSIWCCTHLNFILPEMLNFLSHWLKWGKALHDDLFGVYPCKSLKLISSPRLTPPRSLCSSAFFSAERTAASHSLGLPWHTPCTSTQFTKCTTPLVCFFSLELIPVFSLFLTSNNLLTQKETTVLTVPVRKAWHEACWKLHRNVCVLMCHVYTL